MAQLFQTLMRLGSFAPLKILPFHLQAVIFSRNIWKKGQAFSVGMFGGFCGWLFFLTISIVYKSSNKRPLKPRFFRIGTGFLHRNGCLLLALHV